MILDGNKLPIDLFAAYQLRLQQSPVLRLEKLHWNNCDHPSRADARLFAHAFTWHGASVTELTLHGHGTQRVARQLEGRLGICFPKLRRLLIISCGELFLDTDFDLAALATSASRALRTLVVDNAMPERDCFSSCGTTTWTRYRIPAYRSLFETRQGQWLMAQKPHELHLEDTWQMIFEHSLYWQPHVAIYCATLRVLCLNSIVTDEKACVWGIDWTLVAPHLPQLCHFRITGGGRLGRHLVEHLHAPMLKCLEVANIALDRVDLGLPLIRSPLVTELSITGCSMARTALCSALGCWRQLEKLTLDGPDVGNHIILLLAKLQTPLIHLDVRECHVRPWSLIRLAIARKAGLAYLACDTAVDGLCDLSGFRHLRTLVGELVLR